MKPVCTKLASLCSVSYAQSQPSTLLRPFTRGRHCLDVTSPSPLDNETANTSPTYVRESVVLILGVLGRITNSE